MITRCTFIPGPCELSPEQRRIAAHRIHGHRLVQADHGWHCVCGAFPALERSRARHAMVHHRLAMALAIMESQRPAAESREPALDLSRPCKQAPGKRDSQGYGGVTLAGSDSKRRARAHIVAFEHSYGPVPAGCVVDHACHNVDPHCAGGPSCVHRGCEEPAHLRAITNRENVVAGKSFAAKFAQRTHCKNGHELTPENVNLRHYKTHGRVCVTCALVRDQKRLPRPRSERGSNKVASR